MLLLLALRILNFQILVRFRVEDWHLHEWHLLLWNLGDVTHMLIQGLSPGVQLRPYCVLWLDRVHAGLRPDQPPIPGFALDHGVVVILRIKLVVNLIIGVLQVVLLLHVLELFLQVVRVSCLVQVGILEELVGRHCGVRLSLLAVYTEISSSEHLWFVR